MKAVVELLRGRTTWRLGGGQQPQHGPDEKLDGNETEVESQQGGADIESEPSDTVRVLVFSKFSPWRSYSEIEGAKQPDFELEVPTATRWRALGEIVSSELEARSCAVVQEWARENKTQANVFRPLFNPTLLKRAPAVGVNFATEAHVSTTAANGSRWRRRSDRAAE